MRCYDPPKLLSSLGCRVRGTRVWRGPRWMGRERVNRFGVSGAAMPHTRRGGSGPAPRGAALGLERSLRLCWEPSPGEGRRVPHCPAPRCGCRMEGSVQERRARGEFPVSLCPGAVYRMLTTPLGR